ncbi:MAG TPA: tRNA lysidine(34) synthetase TilS, partial [Polyangia bacterium]|nr:tRNA lysidine(34) synthetase TilS [Polyangia bacterium]
GGAGDRPQPMLVPTEGTYALPGAAASLRLSLGGPGGEGVLFDADALSWPLVLRARRPGDRMRPRGGRGSRKLSDLLIDAKVPRAERDRLPVLATSAGVVLYVPGLRPAADARPSAQTSRYLAVTVVGGTAVAPPHVDSRETSSCGHESHERDIKRVFDPRENGRNTF